MPYFAVVDASGNIVNRIARNGGAWQPDAGFTAVDESVAGVLQIGGTYIGGVYTPPAQPGAPALTPAQIAENARVATIRSDATRAAMLTRLQGSTAAQIDTWVSSNVTTLAQAQAAIGIILKLIALDQRQ